MEKHSGSINLRLSYLKVNHFGRGTVHTQKRHRPVTACCTFRPDTGMISYLLTPTDCSELTVSGWNSLLGCQGCISLM